MTVMEHPAAPLPGPAPVRPGARRLPPAILFAFVAGSVLTLSALMVLASLNAAPDWSQGWRPIRSPLELDGRFWVAVMTGTLAALSSGWIWSLKPGDLAVRLFALSGAATFAFCMGAAGNLGPSAWPHSVMMAFVMANILGACAFGMVMIALFTVYPARLPGARALIAGNVIIFGGWTGLAIFGVLPLGAVHQITFLEMIVIVAVSLAQIAAARGDPVRRAIAVWLSASVLVGAGGFIATVAAPSAFGANPLIPNQYAFAFFLIIYAGLAVGLLRYRVFGLGRWAYQVLFTVAAALAVLAVDAALIVMVSLDPARAIGLSLFVVAVAYLPARAWLWSRLSRRKALDQAGLMRAVADVALQPGADQRALRWQALMRDLFSPLDITPAPADVSDGGIEADGRRLTAPARAGLPGVILHDKDKGRALFTPEDWDTVRELGALADYLDESRTAYDRGAAWERTRIARDIHDHIGAQLLTALHVREDRRKDELIRATIGDLRDVIRNAEGEPAPFDTLLADLRAETADRLEAAGLELDWQVDSGREDAPLRAAMQTLRALVREAVSNAIRHAGASTLTVALALDGDGLTLTISDDGRGFDPDAARAGRGLDNMAARVEALGGSFAIDTGPGGSTLRATFAAFG